MLCMLYMYCVLSNQDGFDLDCASVTKPSAFKGSFGAINTVKREITQKLP